MRKVWTVILAAVLAVACLSAAGCGDKEPGRNPDIGKNGTLKVTYYKGGTGSEWITRLAEAFEDETLIKVELEPDANATTNAKTLLDAGRNLPDVMFLQYTNWREYVQKDWLAPMDDLYDGTFSFEMNGNTVTSSYAIDGTATGFFTNDGATSGAADLSDLIVGDFASYGYMAKTVLEDKHYWVVPWTCPSTGFAYNVKMFEEVGYSEPPATESELKDLISKLNAKGYTPFSWGGTEIKYWDFPVLTWWAQYSGVDTWHSFYEFESAEVFNDPGRVQALRLWQELLVNPLTGDFINSIDAPMGRDHMAAQTQFVAGNAAMTPTGAWLETEVGEFIKPGFKFRMMSVPAIEGAKEENGKPVQVLNTEAGSFACIPEKAANVQAAKAFLAFMNRPEWVEKFSETTGQPRPFNYHPSRLEGMSAWNESCFELYETSERMWRVSDSPIFTYAGVTEWPYYGGVGVYGNLAGASKTDPQTLCTKMYDYAAKQWKTWQKAAGIS